MVVSELGFSVLTNERNSYAGELSSNFVMVEINQLRDIKNSEEKLQLFDSKGVEMNSRITSAVLCPIEQVLAKGLAQSLPPVVGVNDYAAQNACLFFFSYDVRIAQQVFLLVQRGE